MSELEIHHETHVSDATGQKVGILDAMLAVALAIVTIASHRTHTAAIMHKSTANDEWSHYQATRVKYHNLELGENLLAVFGAKGPAAPPSASGKGCPKSESASAPSTSSPRRRCSPSWDSPPESPASSSPPPA